MKCCNEDRETPFCPMCGKPVIQGNLPGLIVHIRANIKRSANEVDNYAHSLKHSDPSVEGHIYRQIEHSSSRAKAALQKWEGWYDAVMELAQK